VKKKQGPQEMYWGMIGWNFKGPFHVSEQETKQEKEAATQDIAELNKAITNEVDHLNAEWKTTEKWRQLQQCKLNATAQQRTAEKNGAPKAKISQTYRHKKFNVQKLKRGNAKGGNSWQYVKHVSWPLLWPTCKNHQENCPSFLRIQTMPRATIPTLQTTSSTKKEFQNLIGHPTPQISIPLNASGP
jgi:hypothetical protein